MAGYYGMGDWEMDTREDKAKFTDKVGKYIKKYYDSELDSEKLKGLIKTITKYCNIDSSSLSSGGGKRRFSRKNTHKKHSKRHSKTRRHH